MSQYSREPRDQQPRPDLWTPPSLRSHNWHPGARREKKARAIVLACLGCLILFLLIAGVADESRNGTRGFGVASPAAAASTPAAATSPTASSPSASPATTPPTSTPAATHTTHAPVPVTPTTRRPATHAAPPARKHAPKPSAHTRAPAPARTSSSPTSGIRPGEYCKKSDHGRTMETATYGPLTCEYKHGWRWDH